MSIANNASTANLRDLELMIRIRTFEEKVRELRIAEEIVGSVHLCIGQEAGPAGVCPLVEHNDALFATYRGHGWALACGVPPVTLLAEMLGRATGVNGGRGGSAYFTAPEYGFWGENSIVGAGAPIAVGAALAGGFDGTARVAVTVFGDGAMNQGAVHEALNFASAFTLPVLFICENNAYSELTPIETMVGDPELWKRAAGYGMPGHRIDGNDPGAIRTAAADALARARSGDGPTLLELTTQRLVGHYIGDAEQYRPRGEVERLWEQEPIGRLWKQLLAEGVEVETLDELRDRIVRDIEIAANEAIRAPLADPHAAREHVYA